MVLFLFGRKKEHPAHKLLKDRRKREEQEAYDKELHKARIREAKKRARVDAKKPRGIRGVAARFDSGMAAFGSGLESLNAAGNRMAGEMFPDSGFASPQKKKQRKRPRKKVTEYY